MNEIDIKIHQLEKKLSRLQALAAQVPGVEGDLAALRRARDLLGLSNLSGNGTATSHPKSGGTILDAVERVLRQPGAVERMHVDEIHEAIVAAGLNVKQPSVVAALSRDKGQRFRSFGKNVFGLKRPTQLEEMFTKIEQGEKEEPAVAPAGPSSLSIKQGGID